MGWGGSVSFQRPVAKEEEKCKRHTRLNKVTSGLKALFLLEHVDWLGMITILLSLNSITFQYMYNAINHSLRVQITLYII